MSQQNNDSEEFFNFLLQKSRLVMYISGVLGVLVTIAMVILFNIGQADSLSDKILLSLAGILQTLAEFFLLVAGGTIVFRIKCSKAFKLLGAAMILVGITLVLWAISSAFGTNSKIVSESSAKTKIAQEQMSMIQGVMDASKRSVAILEQNAQSIRDAANGYSSKYATKRLSALNNANQIAQQASEQTQVALQALDKASAVDQEALAKRNTADEVFINLAAYTGVSENKVRVIFLLTRATQIEMIVLFTSALLVIMAWNNKQLSYFSQHMGGANPQTATPTTSATTPTPAKTPSYSTQPPSSVSRFAPSITPSNPFDFEKLKQHFMQGAENVAQNVAYQSGRATGEITLGNPALSQFVPSTSTTRYPRYLDKALQTGIPNTVEEAKAHTQQALRTAYESIAPSSKQAIDSNAIPIQEPTTTNAVSAILESVPALAPAKKLPFMNPHELRMFVQAKKNTIEHPQFEVAWQELALGVHDFGLSVGKMRKHYGVGDKFKTDLYQLMEAMKLIHPLEGGTYELTHTHSAEVVSKKLQFIRKLAAAPKAETQENLL